MTVSQQVERLICIANYRNKKAKKEEELAKRLIRFQQGGTRKNPNPNGRKGKQK